MLSAATLASQLLVSLTNNPGKLRFSLVLLKRSYIFEMSLNSILLTSHRNKWQNS